MQKASRFTSGLLLLFLLFPLSVFAQRISLSGIYGVSAGGTGLSSTTINQLLYSSAANTVAGLATGNNGVLITSGAGVPSISSTIPAATQGNITRLGTLITDLVLTAGLDIRPSADSVTAINIANAAGTDFVVFDTTNNRVGIGVVPVSVLHLGSGRFSVPPTSANPTIVSASGNAGISIDGETVSIWFNNGRGWAFQSGFMGFASNIVQRWSANTNPGDAADIGLARNAAGVLEVNSGTAGTYRDVQLRAINPTSGNVGIRTTSFGTSADGSLSQGIGTAPTTSPADVFQRTIVDSFGAGTASWQGRDEQGFLYTMGNAMFLLGGTTSSFSALKRVSAGMECRLSDDSGYCTSFKAAVVATTCSTVAALPAGTVGDRKCVSDQLTTCPVIDGTFTGGGVVVCSAFYNGTAWVHS